MQIVYQRLSVKVYKGYAVGQGATNIEFLTVSYRLQAVSVPNQVPEHNHAFHPYGLFISISFVFMSIFLN